MNIKTKTQFLIESLNKAAAELSNAKSVMEDADISTAMWAEIKGISNNLRVVIHVLEEDENAAD